jgi:UDP-GlcNAc:undecaprenyl-phosphate GlcNAc-1-phosphate transferase
VPSLTAYAAVFAVAALTTFALTPVVRRLAIRFGAVVKPDERRVHEVPTPTLGGGAMLIGFLVGMLVAWRLDAFSPAFEGTTEPVGIVLAAVLIFLVGMIDDLREVSAPAKTAGTVLAASVLVLAGVSILQFKIPFDGLIFLSPDISYLVSVIWVFLMVNAINLIDGLDGLAAGITAIAAGTFFLYGVQLSDEGLLLEGNIGPLIAASTMVVGGRNDLDFRGQTYFFFAPLVIPLFILRVPIIDTVFAIVRRATRRTGVATADKDHLHHRLMRLGHGQRRSVLILWAWTALLSGFVLFPTYTGKGDAIVPLGILALGLALYTMFHPGIRAARNRSEAADAVETSETTTDVP